MQAKFTLSQVEKDAFSALARENGWRPGFLALLAYKGVKNLSLAEALGISPSMVSKVRRGRDLSRSIVVKLRDLNVPEDLLPQADYLDRPDAEAA